MTLASEAQISYISKFPINKRGYHVLPCISLTPSTMQDWMIGMKVSMGLSEPGATSTQASILSWDDTKITLEVGGKKKKIEFNPLDIQLCVYQFDLKVVFSGFDFRLTEDIEVQPESDSIEKTNQEIETDVEIACAEEETQVESTEKVVDNVQTSSPNVTSYVPKNSILRA